MAAVTSGQDAAKSVARNRTARFCPYCGTKLDEGARFCKSCGEAVGGVAHSSPKTETRARTTHEEPLAGNPTERKTVYEGYVHKCPSCGEVLHAFVTNCPSCGHEIRDTKSSTSVRELALKLERVEAQKMPTFEEKRSVMKKVFGKDFKEEDEAKEALERFNEQKAQEKANLIINFSVPNTKEDILEFMILASSNIDAKHGVKDVVSKTWIQKLEQVYQRAQITMSNHPDFTQIKSIYDKKKQELKSEKAKGFLIGVGCVAGWFFLLGLLWNPAATIGIYIGISVLIIVGVILFKKR